MDVEIFYIWKVKLVDSKISRASFNPLRYQSFFGFIIVIIFINVTLIIIIVIITTYYSHYYYIIITFVVYS